MTPFANTLERLRRSRGLTQTALAHLAGVKPSYISALEKDRKAAPGKGVLRRLYAALELNDAEIQMVQAAIEISPRRITLPRGLSDAEYELVAALRERLGTLSDDLIAAIHAMLKVQAVSPSTKPTKGGRISNKEN